MIVAEGARFPDQGPLTLDEDPDPFGNLRLGGIGGVIAEAIERQTGNRDPLRRSGTPSARRPSHAPMTGSWRPGWDSPPAALLSDNRFGTVLTSRKVESWKLS